MISFSGIGCACVCSVLGAMLDMTLLFFCISATFLMFSLQILFRFCFTQYTYELSDGVLYVKTSMGKHKNTVFSLDVKLITAVLTKDEAKTYGEKTARRFKCCQNLFAKEKHTVIYNNGAVMSLTVECNGEFADLLKKGEDR